MRTSVTIAKTVAAAVSRAVDAGDLPQVADIAVEVAKPRNPEHGDYATNIALVLASKLKVKPMDIAEAIAKHIETGKEIKKVTVLAPGFINLELTADWLTKQVEVIEDCGDGYGASDYGKKGRVQVEFVSVNPTGPLHVGHARGAILGDTIAKLLTNIGFDVQREYYFNDAGNQMDEFFASLANGYLAQIGLEELDTNRSYAGLYMDGLATEAVKKFDDRLKIRGSEEDYKTLAKFGLERTIDAIRQTLKNLGIVYDRWFSERSLIEDGTFDKVLNLLESANHIDRREEAVWFKSTNFGIDEDDVLIRSGGRGHTYFATDIAYHYNKLIERDFKLVINVWGADHHSHITRLKAAIKAFGGDPDALEIVLNQIVRFKTSDGESPFSKRAGTIVTIDELVEMVGVDSCRYLFIERAANSQMVFDIDLAKSQSKENPVYYIQYAHARICSILSKGADKGINHKQGDLQNIAESEELALLKYMVEFGDAVHNAAVKREPHQLAYYSYELARRVQKFYETHRVLDDKTPNPELSKSRLRLIAAAKVVLGRCLGLMGMHAPEEM